MRWSGGENLASQESWGMGGVRGDPTGGIPQAPAVRLFQTTETTPAGGGISAAGHPWNRRRLWPSRETAAGDFLASYLQGIGRGGTRERVNLPASETGGTGPSGPNADGP